MKKFTGFIAAAAIAMTPMSSSALEALTDNAMNDVTGQAGVSIAIDDVILFQTVAESKYTDVDGISESPAWLYQDQDTDAAAPGYETDADAASLVISEKETLKVINGIWMSNETAATNPGELAAFGWNGSKNFAGGYLNKDLTGDGVMDVFIPSELKIDIGQCTTLTRAAKTKLNAMAGPDYIVNGAIGNGAGMGGAADALTDVTRQNRTVSGVVIALPTVEITTTSDSYSVGITMVDTATDPSLNSGKKFIKIEKGNSLMAILGGRLEIAPH